MLRETFRKAKELWITAIISTMKGIQINVYIYIYIHIHIEPILELEPIQLPDICNGFQTLIYQSSQWFQGAPAYLASAPLSSLQNVPRKETEIESLRRETAAAADGADEEGETLSNAVMNLLGTSDR